MNFGGNYFSHNSRHTAKIGEKKQSKTARTAVGMKHWNCTAIWAKDLELGFAAVMYWRME
jgi:hypothetical protein